MLLDKNRQKKMGCIQRVNDRWNDFRQIINCVNSNSQYKDTLLPRIKIFSSIDPYKHFISFELQINNNNALGNPYTRSNQADVVITDTANRKLYVMEVKKNTPLDIDQLKRLLDSIVVLTRDNRDSFFYNYNCDLVVLDNHINFPILSDFEKSAQQAGIGLKFIEWREIEDLLSFVTVI